MRKEYIGIVLLCSALLCMGCQSTSDKKVSESKVSQEQNKSKEKSREKVKYSPIVVDAEIDMENEYPYEIQVNRAANCVTVYGADESGEYTIPVRAMICSTGGDETPTGTFQLGDTVRWQMETDGEFSQYATGIVDGTAFHSVPYFTQNNRNLNTEEYNRLGEDTSGSSICLETADAKWIAENCPEGTKVEIFDNEKKAGPLGKPSARKLEESAVQDPTDKGKASKKNGSYVPIEFEGVKDCEVTIGEDFNVLEGVSAKDEEGKDLTSQIKVYGQLDVSKKGSYTILYVCQNENNEARILARKIKVKPGEDAEQQSQQVLQPEATQQPTETPETVQTPQPEATQTPQPAQTTEPETTQPPVIFRSPALIEEFPSSTPGSVTTQDDTEAPQIVLVASTRYTKDLQTATLRNRIRVSDNSGVVEYVDITVQPVDNGYYVIVYEAGDAAGNIRCISETVQIR